LRIKDWSQIAISASRQKNGRQKNGISYFSVCHFSVCWVLVSGTTISAEDCFQPQSAILDPQSAIRDR
jgi:hypothetical protein